MRGQKVRLVLLVGLMLEDGVEIRVCGGIFAWPGLLLEKVSFCSSWKIKFVKIGFRIPRANDRDHGVLSFFIAPGLPASDAYLILFDDADGRCHIRFYS